MNLFKEGDPILNPIVEAFTKIEVDDLRVRHVTLERNVFMDLVTQKKYLADPVLITVPNTANDMSDLKGQLWGATVEIGNESKVYSEKGMIPSNEYNERTWHDFNYQRTEDIDFKEFKYKIGRLKNMTIIVKSRADIIDNVPKNEMTAIETLREMITETEFRKYMVHGFILVRGASGKVYQIFRNDAHTKVWYKGQLIEEVCVRIADYRIPPTDNLIAFKTLIEINEEDFRKLGNIYNMKEAA